MPLIVGATSKRPAEIHILPNGKQIAGSWVDFVPLAWRENDAYAAARIELHASNFEGTGDEGLFLQAAQAAKELGSHSIGIAFANFTDPLKFADPKMLLAYNEGQLAMNVKLDERVLPPGGYVLLSSPTLKSADGENVSAAIDTCMACVGYLCAVLGPSIAHQFSHVFSIDLRDTTKFHGFSEAIENHASPANFVYTTPDSHSLLAEYLRNEQDIDFKRRVELAFLFIGRAQRSIESTLRFFDLWTALEVLFGGYRALAAEINKANKSPEWQQRMRMIKDKRTDLVHNGKRLAISQKDERFLVSTLLRQVFRHYGIIDTAMDAYFAEFETDPS